MSNSPDSKDLPDDDHLREDIGAAGTSEAQSMPGDEDPDGTPAEFTGEHYTSGQLNAGQQVAGATPGGGAEPSRGQDLEEQQKDHGSSE